MIYKKYDKLYNFDFEKNIFNYEFMNEKIYCFFKIENYKLYWCFIQDLHKHEFKEWTEPEVIKAYKEYLFDKEMKKMLTEENR